MKLSVLVLTIALITPYHAILAEKPQDAPQHKILYSLGVSSTDSCEEVLEACDEALLAAEASIASKRDIIEAQGKALRESYRRIAELMADRDSLFNNPWFLLSTGALIGGGLSIVIKKAF